MRTLAALIIALGSLGRLSAQSQPTWHQIGGTAIYENLAGAVSGPVRSLWYTPGTGHLLAETQSGRIFETADFTQWRLNASATRVPAASIQVAGSHVFAAAESNIFSSEDNGRTWINLTAFNNRSVIGGGFSALAVSASNSQELSAANQFGVWRSLDGGLTWQSLNEGLPNLPVRRLTERRTAVLADGSLIALTAGKWMPSQSSDSEAALRDKAATLAHQTFTAAAQSGSTLYAGNRDGRLLTSRDSGTTWIAAPAIAGIPAIDRLWADRDRPGSALAAAGSHLLRTVNSGLFWDDVTGSLPPAAIHGITADASANVVYLATDRGIFAGTVSLYDAGSTVANWKAISLGLPAAPAWDVRLNADNTLTVALDGYGVFEAAAPHQTRNVRLVSGADLIDRPAAPGSLISVLGANVTSARLENSGSAAWSVLASSSQSSQLQVPFGLSPGTFSLSLQGPNSAWILPLVVRETAPAIFVDADSTPLIVDVASGLVMDSALSVRAGTAIGLLATGLGKVTPDWPNGVPAPLDSPPVVTGSVAAFLDGVPLVVSRATLAPGYVGYYLVELSIPAIVNRGAAELRLVMNGLESNRVKLFLEPDSALQ